jgi:hypothetical protein
MRATMSDGPPALKPTMIREGLEGYVCACATATHAASTNSDRAIKPMGLISF